MNTDDIESELMSFEDNALFSQSFSLKCGIKAPLTELLDFASSGKVEVNVSYNLSIQEM